MNVILILLSVICVFGLGGFIWEIHNAPVIEDTFDAEDYLLRNEPNYLGQGHWIKK